ncbi:sulfotransferase family protein [Salidesulfovibrio brasiliensis]
MHSIRNDIIFFHIPKAAGTSFYRRLGKELGATPVLFRHVEEDAFLDRLADPAPALWTAHPSGGFDRWKKLLESRPEARFVTYLREPVDRYVSEYFYKETEYREMGIAIEDTLDLDPLRHLLVDNLQTKIVASMGQPRDYAAPATQADLDQAKANLLRHFSFGLVEKYEETYARIVQSLGGEVHTEQKRLNANVGRKPVDAFSDELVERIELHNLYDLDLYDFAVTLFLGRLRKGG